MDGLAAASTDIGVGGVGGASGADRGASVASANSAASMSPASTAYSGSASQFVIAEFIMPTAICAKKVAS